jgi:ATPase family AAA domain-containing protein 3A/B
MSEETINQIALETKGFSGRELSKLVIAWQAAAYGTQDVVLTKELMTEVLGQAKSSKVRKHQWLTKGEVEQMVSSDT